MQRLKHGKRIAVAGSRCGIPSAHRPAAERCLLSLWRMLAPIELCHGNGRGIDRWSERLLVESGRLALERVRVFPPGVHVGHAGFTPVSDTIVDDWGGGHVAGPRRTAAMCAFMAQHGGGWVVLFPGGAGTQWAATYARSHTLGVIDLRAAWEVPASEALR